jgi:hypothetical protein
VSTHGIKTIALEASVVLNNEVGGIALQALGKGVVAGLVGFQVWLRKKVISILILGG